MPFDVCVVIPTHNRAALLRRTLDSVLNQTYPAGEIVVADDGSEDETEALVRKHYPSVKYVWIRNSGPIAARIAGVRQATCPWVVFLDSDDLWAPEKLSRHARLVEAAPEVSFSFSNFRVVVDDIWQPSTKFDDAPAGYFDVRRRTIAPGMHVVEESLYSHLLRFQPIFPSASVIRRDFYDRIGGWDTSVIGILSSDLEFSLRCVQEVPIGVIDEPLVGIRKHSGNRSGTFLKTIGGQIRILRFALEHHRLTADEKELIREQIRLRSVTAAEVAFNARDFAQVRRHLEAVPLAERNAKLHLKWLVSQLPDALGQFVCDRLLHVDRA